MDGSPTSSDEFDGRAAALLEPIAGPEPAGQSAGFDPRYEAVRAEIGKLDAPTGGEIDWKQIAHGCRDLLSGTSKDFLLASYHAYALVQLERWTGLAVGLSVISGLIDRFWDTGFPPIARPRGRGNALDWLVARLEILVPQLPPRSDEAVAFESVRSRWSALSVAMRERLGENCPGMGGVGDALERHRLTIAESTPAPTPAPAAEPTPSAPTAVPEPTPAAATPIADASAPAPAPAAPAPAAGDPLADLNAIAAQWLQPIPGDARAGVDARFEPAHEAARAEIAKLEALSATPPDWKVVADAAGSILQTKSKDLLIAGYLAFANFKRAGLRELAIGFGVVTGVIDGYWDDLQPTRIRGRSNALAWFVEQTEEALAQVQLEPKMRADVLALDAAIVRFVAVTRDRFGAEAPSTSGLGDRMKRMLLAVPEAKPEPVAQPTTAPTTAAAPTPAPAAIPTTAAPGTADDVATFLQETGRALVRAANVVRTAAPTNPTAYRLLRVGLYLHIQQPPPESGGKTQIPAMPAARRQQFALMEQNAKWEAIVEESESALGQFRFCLDLHRITYRALERLGEAHAAARTAIVAELGAVLRRMPSLVDLFAVDGSPLADPETKAWIGEMVLAGSGGAAAGPKSDDGDAAAFAEVRGLMTGGKQGEAMKVASLRIDAATRLRQRFERRVSLAQICLDTGQAVLARGMFAALDRELGERGLVEWEPELAARVLEGFVRSIRAAAKAGARYDGAELVYERLCLLDPAAAARLSG